MNTNKENQTLACDLTAIPPSVREEHIITVPRLFQTAQEVQELSNGYAFRFLNESGKFMAIAKYIENERLCCPFFNFELDVKPNGGALWLRLTGGEDVKELLRSSLLESSTNKNDLKKLIQTGGDPHFDELVTQVSFPDLNGVLNKTSND
jgi:hypothetical protein